jgi:hypothetical protein
MEFLGHYAHQFRFCSWSEIGKKYLEFCPSDEFLLMEGHICISLMKPLILGRRDIFYVL